MTMRMAEQVADAVLYEGYVLYPYRASAAKNQFRWQVGLIAPRDYSEATGADPWVMQTECLAEPGPGTTLCVRVRCLHVQERRVEQSVDPYRDEWRAVDALQVDDRQLITWDEAVVAELTRDGLSLDGGHHAWSHTWTLDPSREEELVYDARGHLAARIVRRRHPVECTVHVLLEPCERLVKVRVRIENVTACAARTLPERALALRQSLAGTHTMLTIANGVFVSLLDPPAFATTAAATCSNLHTWPVLVGPSGTRNAMLSSPVILYDYPAIAPESQGDLCDATEIDELLTLRVQTLTDEEKREARATDERAAQILDRAGAASPETMRRLHGAIRHAADAPPPPSLDAWQQFLNGPEDAAPGGTFIEIGSTRVGTGSRVRLAPTHRADSMDICLRGRLATVTGVHMTLENKAYIAVTLDDDPFGADGSRYRRALFFHPDEVVPLDVDPGDTRS